MNFRFFITIFLICFTFAFSNLSAFAKVMTLDEIINQNKERKVLIEKVQAYNKEFDKVIKANYKPVYTIELSPDKPDDEYVVVKLKINGNGDVVQKTIIKNGAPKLLDDINNFLDKTKMPVLGFKSDFYAVIRFNPKIEGIKYNISRTFCVSEDETVTDELVKTGEWYKKCVEKLNKEFKEYWPSGYPINDRASVYVLITNTGEIQDFGYIKKAGRPDLVSIIEIILNNTKFDPPPVKSKLGYYPMGFMFARNSKEYYVDTLSVLTYKEFDWVNYIKSIETKIMSNWHPVIKEKMPAITAYIEIAHDGSLVSSFIKTSSGDKEADNIALEAIKKAAPFGSLPDDFNQESVIIEFNFSARKPLLNSSKS